MPLRNSTFTADLSPADSQYAVALVDRLMETAIDRRASDLHLHPRSDCWEILLRIDGVLTWLGDVPKGETTDPVSRLMVLANLPTYRSDQPLEGSIRHVSGVEMRLGTFPTVHGQRAVLRLLDSHGPDGGIDALGLPADVAISLGELCQHREGVILWTGPAGSGKTTTLYACLRTIRDGIELADDVDSCDGMNGASDVAFASRPRRSILTLEDPIESIIDGISQSQLARQSGLTLAAALRSAVRQDPEVLLVSEIRDADTADAVLGASLTGHLCFSSMHAIDAAAALRRLSQMQLASHLVRSGLLAIGSQRLLRRMCRECRPTSTSATDRRCPTCGGLGYHGRLAIAECVRFDSGSVGESMLRWFGQDRSADEIRDVARQSGMISLKQQAWRAVEDQQTDELEITRVLGSRIADRADG